MQHDAKIADSIVVTVEGLGTTLLGAYGAATARTPNLDGLAARGTLLDQCFLDSMDLVTQLSSLWTGQHALGHGSNPSTMTLWQQCDRRQVPAMLLTDNSQVASHAEQSGCEQVVYVEPTSSARPIGETEEAQLTGVFAHAADQISGGRQGLIWVHSQGLRLPWDAPMELRQSFRDPDDPDPPDSSAPGCQKIGADTDPDLVIGWQQVALAQAHLIDESIGWLWAAAAQAASPNWRWLLAGLGSVPLGEHGRLGHCSGQLWGTELATAAVLLPGDQEPLPRRRSELLQLPDLYAMLATWLDLEPVHPWGQDILGAKICDRPLHWDPAFQLALVHHDDQRWIRCPAWSAVLGPQESNRLFVKPDDRWEVTEVADRRPDVLEQLESLADKFQRAIQAGERGAWATLSDELTGLMR